MDNPEDTQMTRGSGNVFADLGLDDPKELQLKARLTHLINHIIEGRDWTQQQTADTLGIKQPDVSALARGRKLEHYSVERLMTFLGRLEQKVTITVSSDELPPEEIIVAAQKVAHKEVQIR